MPYLPPHLRGKQDGDSNNSLSSSSRPAGSSDNLQAQGSSGGGSSSRWGSDGGSRRPGLPRTPSSGNIEGRGGARRGYGSVEPVIGVWEPSDRVKALNAEQIADIRQRLNVDVKVPEGQPEVAAPIESFKDMVSSSSAQRAADVGPTLALPGGCWLAAAAPHVSPMCWLSW